MAAMTLLVSTLAPSVADAQAKKRRRRGKAKVAAPAEPAPKPKPRLSPSELDKLAADLISPNDKKVVDAAAKLGESGSEAALDRLLEVLAIGTTPDVSPALLDAVGEIDNPKSLHALVVYSGNLNLKVRLAAVGALAKNKSARATQVLHERLGDPEPEVRKLAADALAERKDATAVDKLFKLVKKNDPGATAPLGKLAPLDRVTQIAELRGLIADGNLAVVLAELLMRKGTPDRLRLDLVRTLGALPGADATTALVEYVGSLEESDNSPSKEEAQNLIDQRGDL